MSNDTSPLSHALAGIQRAVPVLSECVPRPPDFRRAFEQLVAQVVSRDKHPDAGEVAERLMGMLPAHPAAQQTGAGPAARSAKWRQLSEPSSLPDPWVNGRFHELVVSTLDDFLCLVVVYQAADTGWQYAAFAVHELRQHSPPVRCIAPELFATRDGSVAAGQEEIAELVESNRRAADRRGAPGGAQRGH
ncbi:MAG: hypothetical protein M3Q40_02480 [Pseudomonadota bacterium]|nr:hypothetical protein [Pseudomonadota bacterium]